MSMKEIQFNICLFPLNHRLNVRDELMNIKIVWGVMMKLKKKKYLGNLFRCAEKMENSPIIIEK